MCFGDSLSGGGKDTGVRGSYKDASPSRATIIVGGCVHAHVNQLSQWRGEKAAVGPIKHYQSVSSHAVADRHSVADYC